MLTGEAVWKYFALVLGFSCCDMLTGETVWKYFASCAAVRGIGSSELFLLLRASRRNCLEVFSSVRGIASCGLFLLRRAITGESLWNYLARARQAEHVRGARARSACAERVRSRLIKVLHHLPYPLRSFSVLMLLQFVFGFLA